MKNRAQFLAALAILQAAAANSEISRELVLDFESGKKKLIDTTMVHRALISANGGVVNTVMDQTVVRTPGLTDFQNGALTEGQILVVQSISVGFGITANTNTDPRAVRYGNLSNGTVAQGGAVVEPVFQLAELIIRQDGKMKHDAAIRQYLQGQAGFDPNANFVELANGFIFNEKTPIGIELKNPANPIAATATSSFFIEVAFKGLISIPR